MKKISIIDYGSGNLLSVYKALKFVSSSTYDISITSDEAEVSSSDKIVFPGQGAIKDCMKNLKKQKLDQTITELTKNRPFFGICLGLQSLMEFSEEGGGVNCLGLVSGKVKRFDREKAILTKTEKFKVPHMGWNKVNFTRDHPLLKGLDNDTYFYFVHSFYVEPIDQKLALGKTDYLGSFTSILQKEWIFATQFHPEKSAEAGLILLENFLKW
ncbi:MAG: imidazole glycerol phosphate synthase subunit HisH [Methylococcaceae bacterium TMED69]|nr:imidazole glycerol phosphate synthase subunit HisH [Pseudomonadota bacterium]OUU75296.1 MAG: imidazole glycerol phosphate synthase subunit HisH [Methylococcaceae bacterium TMED69]